MILDKRPHFRRDGLTLPEVLLAAAICVVAALFLLMRLPRGREQARATACTSNLNQIGQSLGYYVESTGVYPVNESWTGPGAEAGSSVLVKLRDQGKLWGFAGVQRQIDGTSKRMSGDRPDVPVGLRCHSDRTSGPPSATNYRANAGAEPTGVSGPFAIGKRVTPAEVEAADGLAFTAAFAERLRGTTTGEPGRADYMSVKNCDDLAAGRLVSPGAGAIWLRDAGHDWSRGDWPMTLYQHDMRPNAPISAVALNRNCAAMGSASGHPGIVHVLLLDGSVRPWRDTVDGGVWRRLGNYSDSPSAP